MKYNKLFISSILSISLLTTGCSAQTGVSKIPPLTLEEVAGTRLASLTSDEKEGAIYKFISDTITVDKERLIEIPTKDVAVINSLLSDVNEFLKGTRNDALSDQYGNYLLLEFAKTPYEWQQTKVDPVGFDPAARLYFVDVTYTTTSTLKNAVPNSAIPNGSPEEVRLKQKRYTDYVAYLTAKNLRNEQTTPILLEKFVTAWGAPDVIMQEQQGVSLLERTRSISNDSGGIGKLTYAGLVADSKLSTNATMTFRYVLKYKYNLGEETDLQVTSAYLKNFQLNNVNDILGSYKLADPVGIEVLKPFIDQVINSYNRAVEESNTLGLYSLFDSFGGMDKYYNDIDKYTYTSTGGYTYNILSRSGTTVSVLVNRVNHVRARDADMSLPTYNETLVLNLVLSNDDKIRIKSVYPIKIELIGEPLSIIKNVSGISDKIQYSETSFTESNKKGVEDAIKNFSKVVVSGNVEGSDFINAVDLGVSQTTLQRMIDTITAIKANKKITYLISWDTKTNVYTSVTIREIFEGEGGNFDTEAAVDLVNRGGTWKVVNYVRKVNVKTDKTNIDTKNALSIDENK